MPNWCYNSATISHTDMTKIDVIEKALNDNGDWFSVILPCPEEEKDNWYKWNCENWGTKRSPLKDDTQFTRVNDNTIKITFCTPWQAPIPLYAFMEKDGFSIKAQYEEDTNQLIGCYSNGKDESYEYDIRDLASIEELPQELIEFGDLLHIYIYIYIHV